MRALRSALDEETLAALYPFHFRVDAELRFVGVGPSLRKVAPEAEPGALLHDCFVVRSPDGARSLADLARNPDALVVVEHLRTGTLWRGSALAEPGGATTVFVGSPWLTRAAQVRELGLTFADFAPHDPAMDVLHLLEAYEQALRDAKLPNQLLERFFALSPDVFCIVERDGTVARANPAWTALLGRTAAETVGRSFAAFVHPDDAVIASAEMARAGSGTAAVSFESRHRTREGGWTSLRWSAIADAESGRVYVSGRDLSAEIEVREVSNRIVEASPSGMLLVDETGAVTHMNAQAERLFGYARGELLGKPVDLLVPAASRGAHGALVAGYMTDRAARSMGRTRDLAGVRKDGAELPIEVALNPIAIGGAQYVLAAVTDISERKRFENELRAARDAALQLANAKAEFLANMSHELRTPMNGVIGMLEIALEKGLGGDERRCVEMAHASADSLLAILDEILDFSKIEAGHVRLGSVPMDVHGVVDEVILPLEVRARRKGLRLRANVDPAIPASLRGDPNRLRQVLINLVGNALKFTERGFVQVTADLVEATSVEAEVQFSVRDTGIGISREDHERIFEQFAQADGSTTRRYGGTGLGLSICDRIVRLMGGELSLESELGKGSTFGFRLRFPVEAHGEAPLRVPESRAALAPFGRQRKLLLVEDNPVNQEVAARILQRLGFEPVLADDGRQALEKYAAHPDIALVLMDVQMPIMGGFEATAELRAREAGIGRRVPILAMTAHAMKGDGARCLAAGMDEHIAKPIRLAGLAEVLRRWLP